MGHNNQYQNHNEPKAIVLQSNEEYPEIIIDRKSLRDARILSVNLASEVSEMSAINQYLFEYFQLYNEYKDIAVTLKRISIVEMHHMDIIGKMLIKLGSRAKFNYFSQRYRRYMPWNSNFLHYGNDIKKLIEYNIKSEQEAIRQYKHHAKIIDNGNISQVLYRIIEDEEIHIQVFKDILCRL